MNSEPETFIHMSDRELEKTSARAREGYSLSPSLGELAANAGINLGVAVAGPDALERELYSRIVREFASITPANALKIGRVYPRSGEPDYAAADAIAEFARENGAALRGHLCISRCGIPSWLFGLGSSKVKGLVKKYIQETIARYEHIVTDWDVAVELFGDEGKLRATLWSALWGEGVFETLFSWAREANPKAKLFYSDFNLHKTAKQRTVLNMIAAANRDRQLIDGIAVQCHHNISGILKLLTAGKFLNELRSLGLSVCFSEITVWCRGPLPKLFDFKAQAAAYRQVLQFGTHHGVKNFTIWGVNDSTAWRHPKLTPFLFDDEYLPKPAYAAVRNFLIKRAEEDPTLALDCKL